MLQSVYNALRVTLFEMINGLNAVAAGHDNGE